MKDIEKLEKEFYKLEEKEYKADDKLQDRLDKANCIKCNIYLEKYKKIPFEKRFYCCSGCKNAENVIETFNKYNDAVQKKLEAMKNYALAIYELYNSKKPTLVHTTTKKIVKWDEAFSQDFSELEEYDYNNLIGLIDKSRYGDYRLK